MMEQVRLGALQACAQDSATQPSCNGNAEQPRTLSEVGRRLRSSFLYSTATCNNKLLLHATIYLFLAK